MDPCPPVIFWADVCRSIKRMNTHRHLDLMASLAEPSRCVSWQRSLQIFLTCHGSSLVPTCFKKAAILPVPKKSKVLCLNDYRPVALPSTIMRRFERFMLEQCFENIQTPTSLPDSLDPLPFAYSPNKSIDDSISLAPHNFLSLLDHRDTYVRMLFIHYSSAICRQHDRHRPENRRQ